jgi:hypothetical protein
LGVLLEKAKTTPDSYPMTVSALVSGCNQKSNRSPQMQLDEEDVIEALDTLRVLGAAREVQGSGRVNKYRHAAYEWLDVNSPQAAVMVELMLRGPQTAGELRSRASRMEPFADLAALQQTLAELTDKGLVQPLSPPGRGQQFAHTLYEPQEWDKLAETQAGQQSETTASGGRAAVASSDQAAGQEQLSDQIAQLRTVVEQLQQRVSSLETRLGESKG